MIDAAPLAPLTTLELGGPARHLVEPRTRDQVLASVAWAKARGAALLVLGGGSNVVISDAGFDGLVLRTGAVRGRRFEPEDQHMLVHAAAGEPWDPLVADVVARGWAGVECLSGIPGLVGATPIQNVGAYGQEVADTIRTVTALDRATGQVVQLDADACDFAYRDSMFKRRPDAYVILEVTFALLPGGAPRVRYQELAAELDARLAGRAPSVADVSETVRALRRRKSMLLDRGDPNHRSVGSFFTNPVLSAAAAGAVVARAVASGAAATTTDIPQFPAAGGREIKLSAAWLIEHTGFVKGFRRGAVGLSTNHALALVHHGGGTTAELLALAHDIQQAVQSRFGVPLTYEPVLVPLPPQQW